MQHLAVLGKDEQLSLSLSLQSLFLIDLVFFSLISLTQYFIHTSLHQNSDMTQPAAGKPTAGVLQIPVAVTHKSASTPAKKAPKPPTPRLKLLIRRLPPGLTQAELESALGEEWKAGAGKIDWLQYKPGKVSKE